MDVVGSGDRTRVLVVDEDEATRDFLAAALADEGYSVRAAADGAEALAVALDWRPRVVLLDLFMPRMDGFQFLEQYRTAPAPRAAVVVVTVMGVAEQRAATAAGADAIIVKPFDIDTLLEAVARRAGGRGA